MATAVPASARTELPFPGAAAPGIACTNLSAGYLGRRVLQGITFSVRDPAIYVVLGPNGAGKTTLLRTLAGILEPYSGTITIDGVPIGQQEARDRIHFLSHMDGIPEGLRVLEAVRYYTSIEQASETDVQRVLRLLDIESLSEKFFSQLSQGQKKRVALARIFLQEREIYLLDEPTSNLDPKVAGEIRDLMLSLSRRKIVLYSSHNLFEAREIGQQVIAVRDGRLKLFCRMSELRPTRYVVGVRVTAGGGALPSARRQGDYFRYELSGPEEVPELIDELRSKGVQIREVKELENPLEDLFD